LLPVFRAGSFGGNTFDRPRSHDGFHGIIAFEKEGSQNRLGHAIQQITPLSVDGNGFLDDDQPVLEQGYGLNVTGDFGFPGNRFGKKPRRIGRQYNEK